MHKQILHHPPQIHVTQSHKKNRSNHGNTITIRTAAHCLKKLQECAVTHAHTALRTVTVTTTHPSEEHKITSAHTLHPTVT